MKRSAVSGRLSALRVPGTGARARWIRAGGSLLTFVLFPAAIVAQEVRWIRSGDSLWAARAALSNSPMPPGCEAFALHPRVAPPAEVPDHCIIVALTLSDSALPDPWRAMDSVLSRASLPYGTRRPVREGWVRTTSRDGRTPVSVAIVLIDSARVRVGLYARDDGAAWRQVENLERAAQVHADIVAGRVQRPRLSGIWEEVLISDLIHDVETLTLKSFVLGRGLENMTISGAVRDQPWDVALREIFDTNGIRMIETAPGIVRVVRE